MAKLLARLSHAFRKNRTTAADTARTAFGIGTIIHQRYRLDAEIGRGGMGIVYRARDIPGDRNVAVKVINIDSANALTLQQFVREAEITARLKHPHIVAVHEIGMVDVNTDSSLPYIVMELVQGKSLADVYPLTYAKISDIGKQICDALGYAHDQGFVYRDLKPGNVILEKLGFGYFVKLLDFGLARPRGETYLPRESTVAGTVFYLAPELIAGQPADIASDLYALGATLYEMITGRVPFFDIDKRTILSQHLSEVVPPPSQSRNDVPPELESIVLRLLEKKPEDRFTSAHEVYHVLERAAFRHEPAQRGNLPQTNLTEGTDDVQKVIRLLESNHLVTLSGDDSALALAVGSQLSDEFADGMWLVRLKPVTEPGMVLPTVASILGVSENANRPLAVSLIESLREKNLLLILDGCDHLPDACAQFVETILHGCPDVYFLATSNRPLNISAEMCYRVKPPLGFR